MSPEEAQESQRQRSRAYYESHREEVLERQRQKRLDPMVGEELRAKERARKAALSPEERERRAQQNRDWYRQNPRSPEKNAANHYRHRYGLSAEQRAQMIEDQQGLCYLCGEPLPSDKRRIHTDHDRSCCRGNRSCGSCIRGLACEGCNTGVGCFGDDPDRMRRVADNLEMASRRLRDPARTGSMASSNALAGE